MLRFKAQLRIWSKELTLQEIEKFLGVPSKGHSIGDEYSRRKRLREESLWVLKSSLVTNDTFEGHLSYLIDFLDTHADSLMHLKERCGMDFFCMLSSDNGQGTTAIPSKVMGKLAAYDLNLILDVYVDNE